MTLGPRGMATVAAGAAVVALGLLVGCGSAATGRTAGSPAAAPATTAPVTTAPATASPASTAPPTPAPATTTPARTAPATTAPALASGEGPAGFWYGTDSSYVATPGPAPYHEPAIGGAYGGYIGMVGNWAAWQG